MCIIIVTQNLVSLCIQTNADAAVTAGATTTRGLLQVVAPATAGHAIPDVSTATATAHEAAW